jgi:hypothetical protein
MELFLMLVLDSLVSRISAARENFVLDEVGERLDAVRCKRRHRRLRRVWAYEREQMAVRFAERFFGCIGQHLDFRPRFLVKSFDQDNVYLSERRRELI